MSPDNDQHRSAGLFDGRAIVTGAGFALAVAVPTIVAASLTGIGPDSNLVFIPFFVYLAGQVFGGWQAARRQPDAPLTNGAMAALVAVVLIEVVASAIRVNRGTSLDPESLILNAFLAASGGILGGLIATRRRSPEEATAPKRRPGRGAT